MNALPKLPDLASVRKSMYMVQAPSGTGWGFTPSGGWDFDAAFNSFVSSVGGGGGGGGGGGSTLPGGTGGYNLGLDIGLGGVTVTTKDGSGNVVSGGGVVSSTSSLLNLFSSIPWSRIAAFLLGLLLIVGGIYLIKPVQQVVTKTVKGAIAA